jgi:hypothetical protein
VAIRSAKELEAEIQVLLEMDSQDRNTFRVETFENAGLLTYDRGLVLTTNDGAEFQITIVASNRRANCPEEYLEEGETLEFQDQGGGKAVGVECCDKMFDLPEQAEIHENRHIAEIAEREEKELTPNEVERVANFISYDLERD